MFGSVYVLICTERLIPAEHVDHRLVLLEVLSLGTVTSLGRHQKQPVFEQCGIGKVIRDKSSKDKRCQDDEYMDIPNTDPIPDSSPSIQSPRRIGLSPVCPVPVFWRGW